MLTIEVYDFFGTSSVLELDSATICHSSKISSTTSATGTSYSSIEACPFSGGLYTSPLTTSDNSTAVSKTWFSSTGVGFETESS